MDSFADILNRSTEDVKRPKALPIGVYLTVVSGPFKPGKVGADQKEIVDFQLKILQAQQVNADDIAAFGGMDELLGKDIRARFFLTEDALYRLTDFFETLGIPKGISFKEALASCPGKQVIVDLTQQPSQDGTQMYNQIKSYAKV